MRHPTLIFILSSAIMNLCSLNANAEEIPVVPPAKAGLSETKLAEVDKFMEKQVANKKIAGGIVIVSHQGKIGFFQTYGLMDIEAKKPMQKDTIFRIYSMSKAITTAALSPGDLADELIEQEIRADLLDDEQATALHADPGTAALVVVRRHRRPDGRLIAIGIHTHPADRFSITMTLPPGTNGGPPGGQQSR